MKVKVINIRYASIRKMDISNGEGVGVALFVQGCHFACPNCFNSETWDFAGGDEWTSQIKDTFFKLIDKPYINRISILGGEPLANENVKDIYNLLSEIHKTFSDSKKIWLYTGYTWEEIFHNNGVYLSSDTPGLLRQKAVRLCNVIIDGKYVSDLKDLKYKWAGSTNQRVIDVKETLKQNRIISYINKQPF